MISRGCVKLCSMPHGDNVFVVIFLKIMYNKTLIRFGFCDSLLQLLAPANNKLACVQTPLPSGEIREGAPSPIFPDGSEVCRRANNAYLDLDYSGYLRNLIQ